MQNFVTRALSIFFLFLKNVAQIFSPIMMYKCFFSHILTKFNFLKRILNVQIVSFYILSIMKETAFFVCLFGGTIIFLQVIYNLIYFF